MRREGRGLHESAPNLKDFYMTGARDTCAATALPDMSGCRNLERFELDNGCFNFVHDLRERIPLPRGLQRLPRVGTGCRLPRGCERLGPFNSYKIVTERH